MELRGIAPLQEIILVLFNTPFILIGYKKIEFPYINLRWIPAWSV